MKPPCIVVFRASDVCHLGVVRSLASLNIDVVSVVWNWQGAPKFHSDQSNCLGRVVHINNPGSNPDEARNDIRLLLVNLAEEYGVQPLLMPTSDSILTFLLDSPMLWSLSRLANGWDFETTKQLLDKFNLSQKIQGSAIRQPETRRCTVDSLQSMKLPFVVKPATKDPVNSFYAEFSGAKALFIRDESERKDIISGDLFQRYPLIVQGYVDPAQRIDDMPVYLATDGNGKIIHCSSVDKVFVHPAGFGTAFIVKEQSIAMVAENALVDFVSSTGIRGLVMLEFIRGNDQDFYFIEANPRPWLLVDFQRLRGRNYFSYLDSTSPKNLPVIIDSSTFYIELTGLCKSFEALYSENAPLEIIKLVKSLDGPKRLSTFDENDPGPMESELQMLSERYGTEFSLNIRAAVSS